MDEVVRLAYVVNRYPAISHTFIRREIEAVEAAGVAVERVSIRRGDPKLVDPADERERQRTRVVLDAGVMGLAAALVGAMLRRPGRLLRTLALAWRLGRRSYRPMWVHLAYVAEACVVSRWMRQGGVDHVHAHFGTNAAAVAMLSRTLGGPRYSFTVHGPDDFNRAELMGFDLKIRHAAFVAAISHYCRSQLMRWCDERDWPKIHVVRCGIEGAYLYAEPPGIGETRQLVAVGRLTAAKGHLLLVEAARRLAAEGLDFRIVLVGDGPMRGRIERTIAEHGLADHVRLAGWASGAEVRRHIVESRAMCTASFAEGLPVVVMESLALGRPVIGTYVAGLPELMTDGETGWLVPAGAVEPLVEAMRQALTAPVERLEAMGAEGRRRVRQRHDVRHNAAELVKLVKQGERGCDG